MQPKYNITKVQLAERRSYFSPLGEDKKELEYKRRRSGVGIKLTDPRYEHRPRHTTKEAQSIGIDSFT